MGDHVKKTLAKPKIELEELYRGIPDDSVNLTFQDLAEVNTASEKRRPTITTIEPISQLNQPPKSVSPSPLARIPSLDFNTGLQGSNLHQHHRQVSGGGDSSWGQFHQSLGHEQGGHGHFSHAASGTRSPRCRASGDGHSAYTMGHDDMSGTSMASGKRGRLRRPGIPHSKICTICSTYTYIFRTRCLVCGRVYCRPCVEMGMGEMMEGRKCVECLGLRFSQRYIEKAGKVGCCSWRYPSTLKQAELKWAEKGPRRSGDKGCSQSGMVSSRARSPVTPRTLHAINNDPSFVTSASYSPYSPHHHLPL